MKKYKAEDHTFVICAYKESPYLGSCIRSVLSQNMQGNVCLTTSTPNQYIAALAQKYQIPVYVNPVSEGIAADWNFAVANAKTALVTLAHQDDRYFPEYTEKEMSHMILDGIFPCFRYMLTTELAMLYFRHQGNSQVENGGNNQGEQAEDLDAADYQMDDVRTKCIISASKRIWRKR